MATPPSDDTRTLFKLLGDGEWHSYEVTRDALAATVPPGRALRKYEDRLNQNRAFRNNSRTDTPLSEDEQIFYGARACAQITISSWKGRGIIARNTDGKKEIRIKPGFKAWGLDKAEEQAPESAENAGGSTDLPQADSERSEGLSAPQEVVSEPAPDVVAVPEPEPMGRVEATEKPAPSSGSRQLAEPTSPDALTDEMASYAWPRPSQIVTDAVRVECEVCGLEVLNQARHDRWHEDQEVASQHPEMALLNEESLRTLLGDVMGLALDRFQEGMQGWLFQQFAQLEATIGASRPLPQRWATGDVWPTQR